MPRLINGDSPSREAEIASLIEDMLSFLFMAAQHLKRHNYCNAYKYVLCWSYRIMGAEETDNRFEAAEIEPESLQPLYDLEQCKLFIENAMEVLADLEMREMEIEEDYRQIDLAAVRRVLEMVEGDLDVD